MQKHIVIISEHYANSKKITVSTIQQTFDTREDALLAAEKAARKETRELNKPGTPNAGCFKWDFDGSEQFDYVVRLWDEDDYDIVTGYKVIEMDM